MHTDSRPQAYGPGPPSPQPANRRPERPWRTEGLPHGQGDEDKSRRRPWLRVALALLVSYGVVFALLSWQDVSGGPATIPYTAFTEQVQARDETYLRGRIIDALGGMAAEEEVIGVVTTGAESDLQTSTAIARQMAGRWGMSDRIGPVSILPQDGDARLAGVSDGMLDAVDDEVRRISDDCYAEARRLLRENRARLDAIVGQLLEHETLDEPEIYAAAGIPHPAEPQPVTTAQA